MKVSIIIPTRNVEFNILRLLQALEKQSFKDFEVIFIDSSTDATPMIIRKYKKLRKLKIKLVVKKCSRGEARNIGIAKAKGKYILFLDGDCIPDREWIKKMLHYFKYGDMICGVVKTFPKKNIFYNLVSAIYNARYKNGAKFNFKIKIKKYE